jgi:hypothetical protein
VSLSWKWDVGSNEYFYNEQQKMKYKDSFTVTIDDKPYQVEVYFLEYKDGKPTRFQIFIGGSLEGFMYYHDGWKVDKLGFSKNLLNEEMINEIGNRLISEFS